MKLYKKEFTTGLSDFSVICTDDYIIRLSFLNDNYDKWLKRYLGDYSFSGENNLCQECENQIEKYLNGKQKNFNLPIKIFATTFQLKVYEALIKIPYGNTVSYGELAHLSGRPGGARAVGGALKNNPIPVIVPCHRVICSDGRLGGFCGNYKMTNLKNSLLKTEGITAISKKNWRNEI